MAAQGLVMEFLQRNGGDRIFAAEDFARAQMRGDPAVFTTRAEAVQSVVEQFERVGEALSERELRRLGRLMDRIEARMEEARGRVLGSVR